MKTTVLWTSLILAAGFMLIGCDKVVAPEGELSQTDIAEMRWLIESDPLLTGDPIALSDYDPLAPIRATLSKTAAPILPRAWSRQVTNASRNITFEKVNDTTVVATVQTTLEGTIRILAKYAATDTAFTVISKPFKETTVRKVKFYPVPAPVAHTDTLRTRWRPREISAVKGGTENADVTITKAEVTIGTETLVIDDPTEYFMSLPRIGRRPLPVVSPHQEILVRITLISADPDSDWVSVHRPAIPVPGHPGHFRPVHERMRLVSQTPAGSKYERIYELRWKTVVLGNQTFFVTALTRGSLHDDTAPFASHLWGVPYLAQ